MQIYNRFGCLIAMILFFVVFFSFTRLLFMTPIGWILIAYLAYRMYKSYVITSYSNNNQRSDTTYQAPEEPQESEESIRDFFEDDNIIDIDFEEVDDDH